MGTFIRVRQHYSHCGHEWTWNCKPFINMKHSVIGSNYVQWVYSRKSSSLLELLQLLSAILKQGSPIIIGGDGRADSPGHSAKFGSYGILDLNTNKVLHIELVQVLNQSLIQQHTL